MACPRFLRQRRTFTSHAIPVTECSSDSKRCKSLLAEYNRSPTGQELVGRGQKGEPGSHTQTPLEQRDPTQQPFGFMEQSCPLPRQHTLEVPSGSNPRQAAGARRTNRQQGRLLRPFHTEQYGTSATTVLTPSGHRRQDLGTVERSAGRCYSRHMPLTQSWLGQQSFLTLQGAPSAPQQPPGWPGTG
jgi:hypothetical protein